MNNARYCLKKPLIIRFTILRSRTFSCSTSTTSPDPATSSLTASSTTNSSNTDSSIKSRNYSPSEGTEPKPGLPISVSPAGTVLRGLNYLKAHDDPISLKEEEYPKWLWSILDEKKKDDTNENDNSDLFAKSKKLRRKAAKKQRKLEALKLNSGVVMDQKVPLTQQSIDLPSNEQGTLSGAMFATDRRIELRAAMRNERRKNIKERNYLKSV